MIRRRHDKDDNQIVDLVDALVARAQEAGASDVHFEPTDAGVAVRMRIDGALHDVRTLPAAVLPNVVTRLKVMAGLLTYRTDVPQEGAVALDNGSGLDLRISTFPTIRGERVAVRLLPRAAHVMDLPDLGLSDELIETVVRAAESQLGLILCTGPAGSGKTTTLYALLRHLRARRPAACMMTVEDPVELRLDGVAQIQVSPHGELTYARALRSLLRQDPQVLLIGEIRDAETARIATEAALTGHLLLSSMHSGSATEAIVRLLEMGIPPYQLTSTLRVVVAQRLLRTCCAACAGCGRSRGTSPSPCGTGFQPVEPGRSQTRSSDGDDRCPSCLGTGLRGRTACGEAVEMTPELRAAILAQADTRELETVIRDRPGRADLTDDARRHLAAGRTTREEVERAVGLVES